MARSVKESVVEECSFNVYVISQTAEQIKEKDMWTRALLLSFIKNANSKKIVYFANIVVLHHNITMEN